MRAKWMSFDYHARSKPWYVNEAKSFGPMLSLNIQSNKTISNCNSILTHKSKIGTT